MKYNILIKYVNSIPSANAENRIDVGRIRLLCEKLGRVNIGGGHIYLSGGEFAHGSGVILESVLKCAGYSAGRITDAYNFDIKQSVYLDGVSPSIEEYTSILTYIRDILKKNKDVSFLREEVVFAFSLYVCKTLGVKYVILENTKEEYAPMFDCCAPYNFAIIPKLYGEIRDGEIERLGECISLVNRGVVTGNNQFYNYFSGRCHKAGIRLSIHRSVDIVEEKMRQQTFLYNKREYTLKSSSTVLRDCAISVLELVDMLKNHGAKIPPAAICDGIKNAGNCGIFEVVSLSPMIISDISSSRGQLENLAARVSHYCEKTNSAKAFVCFEYVSGESATGIEKVFSCLPSVEYATVRSNGESDGIRVCDTYRALADLVVDRNESERLTLIIGSLEFTESLKSAIKAKIDGL